MPPSASLSPSPPLPKKREREREREDGLQLYLLLLNFRTEIASPERTFRFKSPTRSTHINNPYMLSPVGHGSQRLITSPRKAPRKISKSPFKVLDAPQLRVKTIIDEDLSLSLSLSLSPSLFRATTKPKELNS